VVDGNSTFFAMPIPARENAASARIASRQGSDYRTGSEALWALTGVKHPVSLRRSSQTPATLEQADALRRLRPFTEDDARQDHVAAGRIAASCGTTNMTKSFPSTSIPDAVMVSRSRLAGPFPEGA